jgi:hypothetical protein
MTSAEIAAGSGWPRRRTLVALFGLGGVLGAAGWTVFEEAADRSAGAGQAELLAGTPAVALDLRAELLVEDLAVAGHLSVPVFNLGQRAVTVLEARLYGWLQTGDLELGIPVPPGDWASVPLTIVPDCGEQAQQELELVVRTDSGVRDVTVPLPPGSVDLTWPHGDACSEHRSTGVALDAVGGMLTDQDALRMEVTLRHLRAAASSEITVTSLTAERAGFRAEGTGLPVVVHPGEPGVGVELVWTVDQCDLVGDLAEVPVVARTTSPDFAVRDQPLELPGRGVAALARFSVAACPSR